MAYWFLLLLPHILSSFYILHGKKGLEMVTLWFKSSLCFSTLLTFDSSFFLPLPSFFVTFSQTVSDHVIHARLHVVWTRTKGIQSQWTLTETSVKLQQNRGENRAAECGQGCCCCDVNLCPVNVWAELANYKQRWKTHRVLMRCDIRLHTWPRAQLDRWRCLKGGYTRCILLPTTASPSLSFLSCSLCVTLISSCIMN